MSVGKDGDCCWVKLMGGIVRWARVTLGIEAQVVRESERDSDSETVT